LDVEKKRAETRFKKWLHKVLKHKQSHVCHRFAAQIRESLGLDHSRGRTPNAVSWKDVFHYIWDGTSDIALAHGRHSHWKKLIKAAKHVHKVNKKLIAFERGFISEDGIRDREWYRHLGVAPGKWLGHLGCTLYENKLLTPIFQVMAQRHFRLSPNP
jgi:N-acetylated-alpha-linked acidic dipeptidase